MTNAPKRDRNSLAAKILPATHCSTRITSDFLAKSMIPIDRGEGGYPASHPKFRLRERAIPLAMLVLALLFSTALASAQAQRGTLVHEETIRVSPAGDAAKLGEAGRGHELVIIETSRDWTHVEAILREPCHRHVSDDPTAFIE